MVREVVVVRTGTANVASVMAALSRAGARPRESSDPREVEDARLGGLPGGGTRGAAMAGRERGRLGGPLAGRVSAGRPLLAICLGMQMLCDGSEESPGVAAVCAARGVATRFAGGVSIPQLGWNAVEADPGCRVLESGWAYFANSYKLDAVPAGWHGALSDHGGRFVAAMERGPVVACQFHPELSGGWGLALIERWLAAGSATCSP